MNYFAFQWHITDRCDQRCEHCYIFAENSQISLTDMPFQQMEHVLRSCIALCTKLGRLPYLYITGGDPILHRDFWALLELIKSYEIPFAIMGNPFHLTDEVCKSLKYYGCRKYQLSIDGLRDTHDKIRKPGSFDTTIDKIGMIRRAGIHCAIMTTVSGTNISEIPGIIDLVVKNHVDVFAFARYCPTSLEKDTHISPEDYRALLDTCWARFERYNNCGTTFNLKDHLWTLYLHDKGLFSIPDRLDEDTIYDGCNCARNHLTILPNGDVYACRRMESKVGNALDQSLEEVFFGELANAFRSYRKYEKCSRCELLRFCRGCPAVAYGRTHNPYAADPQCWKDA